MKNNNWIYLKSSPVCPWRPLEMCTHSSPTTSKWHDSRKRLSIRRDQHLGPMSSCRIYVYHAVATETETSIERKIWECPSIHEAKEAIRWICLSYLARVRVEDELAKHIDIDVRQSNMCGTARRRWRHQAARYAAEFTAFCGLKILAPENGNRDESNWKKWRLIHALEITFAFAPGHQDDFVRVDTLFLTIHDKHNVGTLLIFRQSLHIDQQLLNTDHRLIVAFDTISIRWRQFLLRRIRRRSRAHFQFTNFGYYVFTTVLHLKMNGDEYGDERLKLLFFVAWTKQSRSTHTHSHAPHASFSADFLQFFRQQSIAINWYVDAPRIFENKNQIKTITENR